MKDDPKVLVIERLFNAPRDRVFKAWTDEKEALEWGGPRSHPIISTEGDLRPGGRWRSVLRSTNDGTELHQGGVYREIVEPKILSFTFSWFTDPQPRNETVVMIRFEEEGSKTRMIFRQEPFDKVENRDGHREGWNSAFDRLEEWLAKAD